MRNKPSKESGKSCYLFSLERECHGLQIGEEVLEGTAINSSLQCKADGQGANSNIMRGSQNTQKCLTMKHKPPLMHVGWLSHEELTTGQTHTSEVLAGVAGCKCRS